MHFSNYIALVADAFVFLYSQGVPEGTVGVENEYLLIHPDGTIGDTAPIFENLLKLGWKAEMDPGTCSIIGVVEPLYSITVTCDAGKGTLEIVLPPCANIADLEMHEKRLLNHLISAAAEHDMYILGLGVQPKTAPERKHWQNKERYDEILKELAPEVNSMAITASSQTHTVFSANDVIRALNTLLAVSGPIAAITANSKVVAGEISNYSIWREYAYGTFKQNTRVGIPARPFQDIEDIAKWYLTQRFFLVRDDHDRFTGYQGTFFEFLKERGITSVDKVIAHLKVLMGTVWFTVRPTPHNTLETRVCCQQPQNTGPAVAALNLGIMQNWREAEELVAERPWGFWINAYHHALRDDLRCLIDNVPMSELSEQIMAVSRRGLGARKANEEIFLEPFADRISDPNKVPARMAADVFQTRGIRDLIEKFAYKNIAA